MILIMIENLIIPKQRTTNQLVRFQEKKKLNKYPHRNTMLLILYLSQVIPAEVANIPAINLHILVRIIKKSN